MTERYKPSFLSEVEAVMEARRPGSKCAVALLAVDDPALGDEVQAAIDAGYTASSIAAVLAARGLKISEQSVQRHKRGDCQCR